ncbi:dTMP kinase [Fundidesulfovibrio terrae]|uniref:dTMP kinase n=1 Tax=Fundidesulfovibrio terrae TaxID=2922866 RepID=UPI001FAFC425|nr:dTMP kinase [Fundidesulfovibrio terrae]
MFVTFEGVEGAGKSTQIALAEDWLRSQGRDTLVTRQPGGCALGVELRRILLDARNTHLDPMAELFMYLADRAQHVAQVIRPALAAGKAVLCDRYHDSTVAYQGYGRGLDVARLTDLGRMATGGLAPDVTVVLDLPVALGLGRARGRNAAAGACQSEGRFEALETDFHERVRQGFLAMAESEPGRFAVVDASGSPDEVFALVRSAIAARLA